MTRRTLAVLLVVVGSTTATHAADRVFRKSDPKSKLGSVTTVTQNDLTLKPSIGTAIKIPANDILKVEWDGERPQMKIARNAETAGRLDEAITKYTEELKQAGTKARLKADIQFLIARSTAKAAYADPKRLDEAITKLEAFRKANTTNFRYYEALGYLGEVYLIKKDATNAKAIFKLMSSAAAVDTKLSARNSSARLLLQQNDIAGALKEYQAVVAAAGTAKSAAELSRKFEAMLGTATCLQQQKKYDDAVKALDDVITQVSPRDTKIQAGAYLRQGDCLQALGKPKDALLAYLHVDVLFSAHPGLHAESLYHLAKLWKSVGREDRAEEAATKLKRDYPNSEWKTKLVSAEG